MFTQILLLYTWPDEGLVCLFNVLCKSKRLLEEYLILGKRHKKIVHWMSGLSFFPPPFYCHCNFLLSRVPLNSLNLIILNRKAYRSSWRSSWVVFPVSCAQETMFDQLFLAWLTLWEHLVGSKKGRVIWKLNIKNSQRFCELWISH